MKKRGLCLLFGLVMALVGCADQGAHSPTQNQNGATPLRGVWIAYYEQDFLGLAPDEFAQNTQDMLDKLKLDGFNAVFYHVRPFCDAVYPSEIFPWSNASDKDYPQGTDPGYDPLEILVEAAHARQMQIHAWINPYRVATGIGPEGEVYASLAENHPVRRWLTDGDAENDRLVCIVQNGNSREIYLNPAEPETTRLIADGVREILENYEVDGIHFDDYFYPTTDEDFDKESYQAYRNLGGTQNLDQWRRDNVSAMVSTVYAVVHSYSSVFGISPAAAISTDGSDRNYKKLYADIQLWASRTGYVDYLMPQLYFGYEYPKESFRFQNLLAQWTALPSHPQLKMYIGLGAYKQGQIDADSDEWVRNDNIIPRQMADSLAAADGYVIFSYSSIYQ